MLPPTYTATGTSLVLDNAGEPHIAYVTQAGVYGDFTLNLASWDGVQWQVDPATTLQIYRAPPGPGRPGPAPHGLYQLGPSRLRHGNRFRLLAALAPIRSTPSPVDPDFSFSGTSNVTISFDEQGSPLLIYDGEMDLKATSITMEYLTFIPLALR